jgi:hypothetical protein
MVEIQLAPQEIVARTFRKFSNSVLHDDKNFHRSVENWRMYWGLDADKGLGQYPANVVQELIREGRHVATYNLCRPTVDNIAGGILKTPMSVDFSPVNAPVSSLTYAVKNMYYADKEIMDWDAADLPFTIAGLIYEGVVEMYVDRTYDKLNGNIGMRYRLPGSVVFDPNWRSMRRKDCRECYVSSWLTPVEMLKIFDSRGEDILSGLHSIGKLGLKYLVSQHAEMQKRMGENYGDNRGVFPYGQLEDVWGSQFRVIQHYHVEKVKVKYEWAMTPEGKILIPRDLKDVADKIEWLNTNAPAWQPDGVYEDEDEEDVQYVTSICPALSSSVILEDRPTEVQCGGLQFFSWSAARLNGEKAGIIDSVKDAQRNVNYWNQVLVNKIQTEGGGGSQWIDPDGVFDQNVLQDYIANRGNPRKVFKLKPGYSRLNANGPAIPTTKSVFPAEVTNHLQYIMDVMWSRLSKVTPASRGQTESSKESGILYRLKKMQSDIEQYTIYKSKQMFWSDWGDAYLMVAAQVYGNGLQRDIYNPANKESFTINERRMDERGVEVIVNDMSKLKEMRHRVLVVEAEDSPSRKVEVMQVASSVLQSLLPTQKATATKLGTVLAKQVDSWQEEDKAEFDELGKLEVELAKQELKTNMAELRFREMQAQAQVQAGQASMSGGSPVGGEADPMAGGGVPPQPSPPEEMQGGVMQPRQDVELPTGPVPRIPAEQLIM